MRIIKQKEWTPSAGFILEDNALLAVHSESNILVTAGPGAGKTELLAQKADYLFRTNECRYPQKILAISFKNDAAENLKNRVIARCGDEYKNRFTSMTYDAFFKLILDHFRLALPEDSRPQAQYLIKTVKDEKTDNIMKNAFNKAGFTKVNILSGVGLTNYMENILASVILPITEDKPDEMAWKYLLKGFDGNEAVLTFKMITLLAEYIVKSNPQIKKAIQCTYSHLFLDEFQDTTRLQYSFLKSCFMGSEAKITAVGDCKQRIMLWAGALKTVFSDFKSDFKSEETELIMNHRSAPRLVAMQKQMYSNMKERTVDIKTADRWSDEDGEIKICLSSTEEEESDKIARDIASRIKSGVKANDICILCKQTPERYCYLIIKKLKKYDIRARIENKYQDLIKEPLVKVILSFMKVSIHRRNPQEWIQIKENYNEITGIDSSDYNTHLKAMVSKLDEVKALMGDNIDRDGLQQIVEDILQFFGIENIKTKFPEYKQMAYFQMQCDKFINLFLDELNIANNDWVSAIENFMGLHSVPIMTIHKSKGLEYNSVYFVGLEDGAFWKFENNPEEDRCAFFVALSRAKEYIVFTYCGYRNQLKKPGKQSWRKIKEFYGLLKSNITDTII